MRDDPKRQHLHIYKTPGSKPTGIYMFAHGNGGKASNEGYDGASSEGYIRHNIVARGTALYRCMGVWSFMDMDMDVHLRGTALGHLNIIWCMTRRLYSVVCSSTTH